MEKGIDHIGITVCYLCHDGKGNILFNKRGAKTRDEHGTWDAGGREEKYFGKVMIGYVTKEYRLVDFVPAEDVSERAVMDIDDFISNYEGDKESLKSILEHIDK